MFMFNMYFTLSMWYYYLQISYYQQPLYTVQNLIQIQIQIRILLVHHTHFSYPRAIIDDFPVTLIEITTYLLSPF
jgi:hypothetical protein